MGYSGVPRSSEDGGRPEARRTFGILTPVLDAANTFLNNPDPAWNDYFEIHHQINHLMKDPNLTDIQRGYLRDLGDELLLYISTVEDYLPYKPQPLLQQIREKGREYIYYLAHPI